jgi:ribosomal protein S18 acetylase RimI-like enzyme
LSTVGGLCGGRGEETNQLFAYTEFESEEQYNALAQTPEVRRWWKFMADIMPTNADNSPKSVVLREVYHYQAERNAMSDRSAQRESIKRQAKLKDGRVVHFRSVRSSDTELFMGFFDGLSARSRDFMHGWSARCNLDHARSITAQAESDDYHGLVVVVPAPPGERIVGYSWIDGIRGPGMPMLGIGIVDEYHDVGLGSRLLRIMIADAQRLGLDRVKLGVWADNARAVHVYGSVGFRQDPALPSKDFEGRIEHYMVVQIRT